VNNRQLERTIILKSINFTVSKQTE